MGFKQDVIGGFGGGTPGEKTHNQVKDNLFAKAVSGIELKKHKN